MKSFIIFIFLFTTIVGKGQIHSTIITHGENLPERDSLPVIMLVSDTVHQTFKFTRISGNIAYFTRDTVEYYRIENLNSYLIKGYRIRERKFDLGYSEHYWMEPVGYLDEDKKSLSPFIIVWQYKTIKI